MSQEIVQSCPICNGSKFKDFIVCKDFTTSSESFQLVTCEDCRLIITNPRPDHQSIGQYYESDKYISHTSKSSGVIDSLYLLARSFTLRWKLKVIKEFNPTGTILDYGCGTGDFLRFCGAKGWKGYGIEPSGKAQSKAQTKNSFTVLTSLSELPALKFNVITLWHVLEHVEDLQIKIEALKNLLEENGTLFVAVPNHNSYDASVYKEYWAAYDVPRHLWHFSKENITSLMASKKLTVTKIKGMKLDSFYISLLSEKYKKGSYTFVGLARSFITALISNFKAINSHNYSSLIYIIKK